MSDRAESILVLIPPAVSVAWVIIDATSGMVAADRAAHAPAPLVQVVSAANAAGVDPANYDRAPAVVCATLDADAPQRPQSALPALSHPALQRLCQAGLKFTIGLPNT